MLSHVEFIWQDSKDSNHSDFSTSIDSGRDSITLPVCDSVPENAVSLIFTHQYLHVFIHKFLLSQVTVEIGEKSSITNVSWIYNLHAVTYLALKQETSVPSSIPDYLDGWEDTFKIPKHYGN